MARIADLFVALAAISTIATFFGVRALVRKSMRKLGRQAEMPRRPQEQPPAATAPPGPPGIVGRPDPHDEERRTP